MNAPTPDRLVLEPAPQCSQRASAMNLLAIGVKKTLLVAAGLALGAFVGLLIALFTGVLPINC